MKPAVLAREAFALARASRVPSLLTGLVVAVMCLATLTTVGRSAAALADMARQMEAAGARQLVVTDVASGGFITEQALDTVRGLNTVERAAAVSAAVDVTSGALGNGGPRIPLWQVTGSIHNAVNLQVGRLPRAGEAVVSCQVLATLRWETVTGWLLNPRSQAQFPVVGCYRAQAPFDDLAAGAVTPAAPGSTGASLRVVVTDIGAADATSAAVLGILSPADPSAASVESPVHLARTAQELQKRMATYGRSLLALILGMGALFIAAVVFSDTLIHRRDLGRRRTLGITRPDLVALVCARTSVPAVVGAAVGSAAGAALFLQQGRAVPWNFTLAIPVLAVLTAVVAAIPPAVHASRRDPVSVMRTP